MSDAGPLNSVTTETVFVVGPGDAANFADAVMRWSGADLTVRVVRGDKMRRFDGLMDEFSAALQFPHYFGGTWASFQECVADMDWLPRGAGIVIAITDPERVLEQEPDADLRILVDSLQRAAENYSVPIKEGEWWDRPAVPFHVVLQGEIGELRRWKVAGATLRPLPNQSC